MPVIRIEETKEWEIPGAFEDISSMLSRVVEHSRALQVLIIELYSSRHEEYYSMLDDHAIRCHGSPTIDHMTDWAHALADQLAACRPRLHAYSCRAWDLNTFPAIPHLKHLMLEVHCDSLQRGLGSLAALKSLETLQLKGDGIPDASDSHDAAYFAELEGEEPIFTFRFNCPSIDLSSHTRLRSLALVNITTEGLFVSPSCEVHFDLTGRYFDKHPVWSIICIDALRSFSWEDIESDVWIKTPQDIPKAMREASCLDCVHISDLGRWICEELPSALACVRVLTMDIMLCVPAEVHWQCVYLHGWNELVVTFEDPGTFARMPMNIRFKTSEEPLGREWLPLDAALVLSKPDWVSKSEQLKYKCECEGACGCKRDCGRYIYELSYEHLPVDFGKFTGCTCGACITCLERDRNIVFG